MIEMRKKSKDIYILFDRNVDFSFVVIFQLDMMNGEYNDGQLSDTYLDNIIKQLEISDGSQATACVRYV